ncbi:hypothetical protein H0H92_009540 [Tricholoma furcatifolium]|nr:hypothetical protein H0H92_009540 [Tricholoma furcatifolium]
MSISRSTTPTPNTFSTNLTPPSESTTSRTPPNREDQLQALPSPQIHSLHPQSAPAPTSTDRRMAKRIQREQKVSKPDDESQSTSSDSQNESTDVHMGDAQPYGATDSAVPPPPKKKRTRTLTTPHQAAVLHALLAKSRFPNTTTREEVGRSIGLSARKVQNQRQKARRPRSESETSRKRSSPRYGEFQSPEGAGVGSFPIAPEPGPSYSASSSRSVDIVGRYRSPEPERAESSSMLSGPGMPGTHHLPSEMPYRGYATILPRSSTLHETRHDEPYSQLHRSPSPLRMYPPPPASHLPPAGRTYHGDPSRTLPPLPFHQPPPRPNFPGLLSFPGPPHASQTTDYTRKGSSSPPGLYSRHSPESTAPIPVSPPYSLQPQPRWGTPSIAPTIVTSHSPSWALREPQPHSRSITPPGILRQRSRTPSRAEDDPTQSRDDARPPRRTGRYDPVRASYVYSSPEEDR